MIDLHAHILPGLDDGSDSLETSLKMLRIAEEDGIHDIILTPHFIPGSIDNNRDKISSCVESLIKQCKSEDININLYPGSEVFIDPCIPALADEGIVCTLNNSHYMLVEFPMMSVPEYAKEVIYQLRLKGFTPIIAHPERNKALAMQPNLLYEYIQAGVLTQINSTSVKGLFGSKVKETALTFLRHGMVHFISTDAHTCKGRSPKLAGVYEQISSEFGKATADKLLINNGKAVLADHVVDPGSPVQIKKRETFILPLIKKLCTQMIKNHV